MIYAIETALVIAITLICILTMLYYSVMIRNNSAYAVRRLHVSMELEDISNLFVKNMSAKECSYRIYLGNGTCASSYLGYVNRSYGSEISISDTAASGDYLCFADVYNGIYFVPCVSVVR